MRWLPLTVLVTASLAACTQARSDVCRSMTYENRNQADYGPLEISVVRGIARDPRGDPFPNVCIGLFTETDHMLAAFAQSDESGEFEVIGVTSGEYRLVAKHEGFPSANAKVRVQSRSPGKDLTLHMSLPNVDAVSYFQLE